MPVLIGRAECALDDKHRLFVPVRYRHELATEKGAHFILAMGLDACLYLYLPSQWERVVARSLEVPGFKDKRRLRAVRRQLFSNAAEAVPDEQGRILIPPHLMEHARLSREVLVLGSGDRAEIWDRARRGSMERAERRLFGRLSASLDL